MQHPHIVTGWELQGYLLWGGDDCISPAGGKAGQFGNGKKQIVVVASALVKYF